MLRASCSRTEALLDTRAAVTFLRQRKPFPHTRSFRTSGPVKVQSSPSPASEGAKQLRRWLIHNNEVIRQRLGIISTNATSQLSQLGERINKISGYEQIELLKRQVVACESTIRESRKATRSAKQAYEVAVLRRSQSQKEVNDLLQRKSSWDDKDVGRFTAMVREDHLYEQEEAAAKEAVVKSEHSVDAAFDELLRAILNRYHEEQVWSDKIRSVSTYGSLAALALNLIVFILAIVIVEPWKRRRLAQTFETRIEELSRETRALVGEGIENLLRHIEEQDELLKNLRSTLPDTPPYEEDRTKPSPSHSLKDQLATTWLQDNSTVLVGVGCTVLGFVASVAIRSL